LGRLVIPIKVCGLTREGDALLAWELGAAALGFVLYPKSPRAVSPSRAASLRGALPKEAFCVGVFVDASPNEVNDAALAARLDAVQLHGRETPEDCARISVPVIKALLPEDLNDHGRIKAYKASAVLLDSFMNGAPGGGTGLRADWRAARALGSKFRLILAGGITPANAREAFLSACPMALDVSSGVESAPGIKDHEKLRALFKAAGGDKGERQWLIG
jgi:phosphoribosylanthranilate isomerase